MRMGVRVRVRVSAHYLPETQRADDDKRQAHNALSELTDHLHVQRQPISEENEDTTEEDLTRVVTESPQGAHEGVLRAAWADS